MRVFVLDDTSVVSMRSVQIRRNLFSVLDDASVALLSANVLMEVSSSRPSCIQSCDVKEVPRSEVMCSGMPNLEIQPESRAAVQEAVVVSGIGTGLWPPGGPVDDGEEVAAIL